MVTAIDTGTDSQSGTQCPPWIFPCDDHFDYYTKLVGRCPAADFREAELVTSRLGVLIGAPVAIAEPIFVPGVVAGSTGLGIDEQWAVGMRRMNVDPEPHDTHPALVAAQTDVDRLTIVALHTWVHMGDHGRGHNFFRDLDSSRLISMDHCSGLRPFFDGLPNQCSSLIDLGGLLADSITAAGREEVASRIASVTGIQISAVVEMPHDPANPWITDTRRRELSQWIVERQARVADLIRRLP